MRYDEIWMRYGLDINEIPVRYDEISTRYRCDIAGISMRYWSKIRTSMRYRWSTSEISLRYGFGIGAQSVVCALLLHFYFCSLGQRAVLTTAEEKRADIRRQKHHTSDTNKAWRTALKQKTSPHGDLKRKNFQKLRIAPSAAPVTFKLPTCNDAKHAQKNAGPPCLRRNLMM